MKVFFLLELYKKFRKKKTFWGNFHFPASCPMLPLHSWSECVNLHTCPVFSSPQCYKQLSKQNNLITKVTNSFIQTACSPFLSGVKKPDGQQTSSVGLVNRTQTDQSCLLNGLCLGVLGMTDNRIQFSSAASSVHFLLSCFPSTLQYKEHQLGKPQQWI